MPAQNTKITELDFDTIKANLKAYLKGTEEFSDYNFEGSGLSLLLNVLANNTHYTGYYTNVGANEGFLDTAVKRRNAVSIAKHLGYTPHSANGANALVDIEALLETGDTPPPGIILPAYTVFGSSGLNTQSSFVFYNLEEKIAVADDDGRYWFRDVWIKEGSIAQTRFLVDTSNPDQTFVIPNRRIDISTLTVTVINSSSDSTSFVYTKADNYTQIKGTDLVYFVQESDDEKFEIYFGDGNVGKAVESGNIIVCEYLICSEDEPNGLSQFSVQGTLPATDDSNQTFDARVTTVEVATGGSKIETVDSIRFYAPKAWTAQNRLVTKNDYMHYIQNNLPNVESTSIWGGEENVPPQYGKVFISLKPLSGFKFSDTAKKNFADNFIRNKSLVSIIPEFVDPEYNYVGVSCQVKYDPSKTTKTQDAIVNIVRNTITNFFNETLEKFNTNFYFSQLSKVIDAADPAIVSNLTVVTLQKRLEPILFRSLGYSVSFSPNKIHPSTLKTSFFNLVIDNNEYTKIRIVDKPDAMNFSSSFYGTGVLQLANEAGTIVRESVGTINYNTGVLTIDTIEIIDALTNDSLIRFTCQLQEASRDVDVRRNNIVVLDNTVADAAVGLENNGLLVTAVQV
jgi:hypothetical protein